MSIHNSTGPEKAIEVGTSPIAQDRMGGNYLAILDDPGFRGLTLYEKKALLVNRELDAHGMGKYQWWIFFLCGFGYFLVEAVPIRIPSCAYLTTFP